MKTSYIHRGAPPTYAVVPVTNEQRQLYGHLGYTFYEPYPPSRYPFTGRYWTDAQLRLSKGCQGITDLPEEIAQRLHDDPGHSHIAFCFHCRRMRPIQEFAWPDGTQVGK